MNNNTSNSNDPSGDWNGYAYYSVGLSLGFLLLMMFIALTAYCCSQRRFQNRQTRPSTSSSSSSHRTVIMERDSSVTIQLGEEQQEAILNSYPVLLFSQAKLHKPDSTTLSCSVCLQDYKDSEWLRLLPDCGHFFHRECIDMWLRLNLSCPMCRNSPFPTPLPTPLAEVAPLATTRHDWIVECGVLVVRTIILFVHQKWIFLIDTIERERHKVLALSISTKCFMSFSLYSIHQKCSCLMYK